MDRWRGKVAVVTGASSGIGLATASALVRQGMIVVGLARRKDKMLKDMSEVKGSGKFYAIECDVSKESSVKEAFEYIKNTFETMHVLINNAGMLQMKSIADSATEELQQIINVNLMGVLYCSKQAITLMKENGNEAYIVNISSILGHKVPCSKWFGDTDSYFNVYPATKFAVTALSEIFINELMGNKIRVTNLSPGFVETEIIEEEDLKSSGIVNNPILKSEDVADSIIYILGTPTRVQITQLTIKPFGEPF